MCAGLEGDSKGTHQTTVKALTDNQTNVFFFGNQIGLGDDEKKKCNM